MKVAQNLLWGLSRPPQKKRKRMSKLFQSKPLLYAILALFVLLVYANHFDNTFHFDDSHTIEKNLYIRDLKNFGLFFLDGRTSSSLPANSSYRPVVTLSTAIDYYLAGGLEPFWFHLSMFSFFILQGYLMVLMLESLRKRFGEDRGAAWLSLACVAIYLLHPVQAETSTI